MEVQEITTVETETAPKSNDEKAQAATIEQLEATKTELAATMQALEDIKLAQSGSDKTVAKLMAKLEEKETGEKTDKQRLEELERTTADAKAEVENQKWLNTGYKEAGERGLPPWIVDGFNKDTLPEFLDKLKEFYDTGINNAVIGNIAKNGHLPVGATGIEIPDIKNMSHEELLKHSMADAEKRLSGN